jgi:hypothetical protein
VTLLTLSLYQPIGIGSGSSPDGGVPNVSSASLEHVAKPLQLFFSFCLNLKLVSLFSLSTEFLGSFAAAALCTAILIPAAPMSAVAIASISTTAVARVV